MKKNMAICVIIMTEVYLIPRKKLPSTRHSTTHILSNFV